MAGQSGSQRTLACALVGIGALLLVVAILIPTYTYGKLAKTPLDLEVTTIADTPAEGGEVLDSRTLTGPGKLEVNKNVPLVSQRFLTVEDPSDSKKITVQAGQTLRRTDRQGDTGLLSAIIDRVTLDRKTGEGLEDPIGSIQIQSDQPAEDVSHTGLLWRFPFDTEQKTYQFFDLNARQAFDINFVEETEVNGTPVYHFQHTIPVTDLSKVVNSPTNKLSLPAEKWGLPGTDPVTMTRYYTNVRDVWVEPKTGVIVKGAEQLHQYYARDPNKPDVTVLKATLTWDENTVDYQIGKAKEGNDKLSLYGRTLPIILGLLGLLLLIAGFFLGFRGGRGGGLGAHYAAPAPPAGGATRSPGDWVDAPTEQINLNKR